MMSVLFTLIGGWRNLAAAVLIAGAVGSLLFYVNAYDSRGREIVSLTHKLNSKQAEVHVLSANLLLLGDTVESLNTRLEQRSGNLEEFCAILDGIKKSTDPLDDEAVGGTAVPLTFEKLKKLDKKP